MSHTSPKIDLDWIRSLAEQGESETLEFKTTTAKLTSIFQTVCAFLNSKGGTLLIGVTDKGKIVGQDVTDKTRLEIAQELVKMEPTATAEVDITYLPLDTKKQIIVIQVLGGKHPPYAHDGRSFERHQSSTARMTQHRYEQLLIHRGQLNHSWEEFLAHGYDIESLDHKEILRTIHEGIQARRIPPGAAKDNVSDTLARLDLLFDENRLKNAAVVLFGKKLFPAYPQCELKMGRFQGLTKLEGFIDNQQVHGNIFTLLSAADDFLMRHLPIASIFTNQFRRTDKPILPVLAVREAMVNAVSHKDYSERSSAITLAIFDDRLEIWNYGTLTPRLKLDDLKKIHSSFPRNNLISNVLYRREFFEKWGTGTNKMIDLCKEADVPEPVFKEYSGGLSVIFKFKKPMKGDSIRTKSITTRQEAIISIIKQHGSIQVRQIIAELSNPPSPRTLQRDLEFLETQGIVSREGTGQNISWILK